MKNHFLKLIAIFFVSIATFSCTNDDDDDSSNDLTSKEHKYLRVLVSDGTSTNLSLVNPYLQTTEFFTAKFAKSYLYTTESQRFAGIVHRENNMFETFDSGYEFHGDHVDVRGTPKFGALTGVSLLPTHFKSSYGKLITFNDGDGTLSIGNEADIHVEGATLQTINAGLTAHHGAMTAFSNGTYAVTEKDNSSTSTLPERVKIINANGITVHASTIATGGIHGNASDGTYAVFGSSSGVLVVQSNGQQNLISLPSNFETAWFGTILETAFDGKFVGYTAAKGAYLIDVVAETITPIIESTSIMQCKVSYNLNKLGVLLYSGDLKIFNLSNLSLEKDNNVISPTATSAASKPLLLLSDRFAYITSTSTSELFQINLSKMSVAQKLTITDNPFSMTFMGYENSTDH
ncbi:hypothetical protein [Mariniflexile sp.]|uniref:hypothetical protein n=1 Tax=Mariniflexile sp. TaxID=1979402 RepID=UPI0035659B5D